MATGVLIEYSPVHTPSTSFYTPDRYALEKMDSIPPLKGRSFRVADTASSTFDMPLQQYTTPPVPEDSWSSEESPSQLLAREMSLMNVDSASKTTPTMSRQTESEGVLATKESTPKFPRCLLSSLTLINQVVSDRLKTYSQPGSPANDRSHSTTPTKRMLIDTSSHGTSSLTFEEEMTEFWMGSSEPRTTIAQETVLKPTQSAIMPSSNVPEVEYPTPLILGLHRKPVDADQETCSTASYSVLSDDTIPESPPPRLARFSPQAESEYFVGLYNIIDEAFSKWESRVGDQKAHLLKFENVNDMRIDLPEFFERGILMGKKPDGDGFWTGTISLPGPGTLLYRLEAPRWKKLLGIRFGFIRNFDCRRGSIGGAILFFARDRKVYYTDEDGDIDQDDEGVCTIFVHGPYDLRTMGTGSVLDPWANSHPPPVSWPDELMSFCGD